MHDAIVMIDYEQKHMQHWLAFNLVTERQIVKFCSVIMFILLEFQICFSERGLWNSLSLMTSLYELHKQTRPSAQGQAISEGFS